MGGAQNSVRQFGLQRRVVAGDETDCPDGRSVHLFVHESFEFDARDPGTFQERQRERDGGSGRPDAGSEQRRPEAKSLQPGTVRRDRLGEETKKLLAQDSKGRNEPRLNRLLLADAYPKELAFQDGVIGVTNQFAAKLASFGFICFLIGRVTGARLLRKFSAHKMLGLYAMLNAVPASWSS